MEERSQPPAIARYLRAVAHHVNGEGPTDSELLNRFSTIQDQAAFELLVWRHAGMVTTVCRSVLRDHHSAEDATQAAFLALARKARSVRENPAGWLYRVARRIAVRMGSRRTVTPAMPATLSSTFADHEEVGALHDELSKLPEKYRLPVLLCFFEGLSHSEAAKRLGWPTGTVAGRIARAKESLHARLTRRGIAIPAAGITVFCTAEGIGNAFAATTTQAAIAYAAGATVTGLSPAVISTANGAIKAMTISKLQFAASACFASLILAAGTAWTYGQITGGPPGGGSSASGSTAGGPPAAGMGAAGSEGAGNAPLSKPVERIKIEPTAPAPGKIADAKRNADYAQRLRSKENLKKIMVGMHGFHDAYGYLPHDLADSKGKLVLSWRVQLLPYLEHNDLYQQFRIQEPWDSEHNKKLLAKIPAVFKSGFEPNSTNTYFQAFAGMCTPFDPNKRLRMSQVSDGVSNTLGVAEMGPAVPWTKPVDMPYHPGLPFPKVEWPFANVIQFAMLDGAYQSVKPDMSERIWRLLIDIDDGTNLPDMRKERPLFPAEAAEEKILLERSLKMNSELIKEIDSLNQELIALQKLRFSMTRDVDKARDDTEQLKRMIEALKPRIKKERDDIGLRPGAKVPDPQPTTKP